MRTKREKSGEIRWTRSLSVVAVYQATNVVEDNREIIELPCHIRKCCCRCCYVVLEVQDYKWAGKKKPLQVGSGENPTTTLMMSGQP
jgi:hypothetical protein